MNERESVAEARENWQTAARQLDAGDRDPDYGKLWSNVEDARQEYERALEERSDGSDEAPS